MEDNHKRLLVVAGVLKKIATDSNILDTERKFRDEAKVRDKGITAASVALDAAGVLAFSLNQAYGRLQTTEDLYQAVMAADKLLKDYANAQVPKSQAHFPVRLNYKSEPVIAPQGVKNKSAVRRAKGDLAKAQGEFAVVKALHNKDISDLMAPVEAAVLAASNS